MQMSFDGHLRLIGGYSARLIGRVITRFANAKTKGLKMQKFIFLILIPLVVCLCGCAAASRIQTPPQDANVCCTRLADLPFTPITRGWSEKVNFDETAKAYRFHEGIGTFKAYVLPAGDNRILEMETDLSNGWLPSATILRPRVLFLDAGKQVHQAVPNPRWRDDLMPLRGPYWISEVPIPNTAKYAVIYNAPKAGEFSIAYSENKTMFRVPVAYFGSLYVEIK